MKNLKRTLVLGLILATLFSVMAYADTTEDGINLFGTEKVREHKSDLDDETKAVVEQMKADGASKEEIGAYLTSQGYEKPNREHMNDRRENIFDRNEDQRM